MNIDLNKTELEQELKSVRELLDEAVRLNVNARQQLKVSQEMLDSTSRLITTLSNTAAILHCERLSSPRDLSTSPK